MPYHETEKRKKCGSILITHMLLAVVGFIWVYPFLWMLAASFKTQEEFFAKGLSLMPSSFEFSNFIRAWNAAKFNQYFVNCQLITAPHSYCPFYILQDPMLHK